MFMKYLLLRKTNKYKSDILYCAPAESPKGQQKVPVLKQTTELCPTRSYYSMDYSIYTLIVQVIPEPRCLDCLYYIIL